MKSYQHSIKCKDSSSINVDVLITSGTNMCSFKVTILKHRDALRQHITQYDNIGYIGLGRIDVKFEDETNQSLLLTIQHKTEIDEPSLIITRNSISQ